MGIIVTDFYSDHDMQCPTEWYGGFKEGRVMRFGDGERTLSNMWTGDWQGSTFTLTISDYDRKLRQQLASPVNRRWTLPLTIRMTTRANRAVLGTPYVVFVGPIIDVKLERPLALSLTLGDIVSQGLFSDQYQVPWRLIRDGFIGDLDNISANLDLDAPEPIIYGQHRRIPNFDPASPQGFQIIPTYLGIEDGDHVWLVCGHACAAIPDVLVWTLDDEGGLLTSNSMLSDPDWSIPHTSAPAYEDRRSATFGNDRRYTLIRAATSNTDANDVVAGDKVLAVFVDGVEDVGDGTGELILDRIQQYKHFLINFVANRGPESYQAGAWLTNPEWSLFDANVPIVEEDSFDAATAIAELRLPVATSPASPSPAGYIGAAIIGATSSDRSTVRRWIADWNRSCGVQFGVTHLGQLRVTMLHPTDAIKAAAPLYTDAYEMLEGSFEIDFQWSEKVNRVPWRGDYEHSSGQWKSADIAEIPESVDAYGGEILGEVREYPFAPGVTACHHLARLEGLVRQHPPTIIRFEATVGPHPVTGDSLGYLDLGDYIRYQHYAAIGAPAEIRLAYVIKHQVQAGKRRVLVDALDCEDLIDFDAADAFDIVSPLNETCATAMVIPAEEGSNAWHLDTNDHATDPSIGGSPSNWSGTEAYHAAWWSFTAPADGTLFLTTVHSLYDTQMAVFEGVCGSPVNEIEYNDNDTESIPRVTSILEFAVTNGTTYKILIAGRGPDDGGELTFGSSFTPS